MEKNNKIEDAPFFSIIVPAYNVEKYITQCLESLLNQTFPSLEIIVIDDGSSDETLRMAEKLSEHDCRIKLIRQSENQSLLTSRIAGMKAAAGKYILFVDSDDFCVPEMCEVLKKEIEKQAVDIIEFAYDYYPGNVPVINPVILNKHTIIKILRRTYPHTLWNKCYSGNLKNKILEHAKPFYCNMSEDVYFSILFFFFAKTFSKTDRILYHYRVGSGLSTEKRMNEEKVLKMLDSILIKNEQMREFISVNRPVSLLYEWIGEKRDLEYMAGLIKNSDETDEQKIYLLRLMDERMQTNYCAEYFIEKKQFLQARKQITSYGGLKIVFYYMKYKMRILKRTLLEKK